MVCWLFVGSGIFSAAFALLGGQEVIEKWVLSLDMSPVQFMILAQFIIFILGWPLEWTEIIIIFMPIFLPLLPHFHIDPLFFGLLVALNLQTAFLSPPVAMAAFYLKGVSPPHVTLNQIFAGMMPFMGIKDIIDTADMPTENGTPLHRGRTPRTDAAVVSRLRAAGAVIMGKTVTTECAYFHPGKTRNPHNPAHTPGGSSSGSAAAVAAAMVPLALGSQTAGSVIRPGAFCGDYAFKPTHGLIPRSGLLTLSRTLDHIGMFARSLEDLALLAEELVGYDEGDPDTRPRARMPFCEVLD